LHKKLRKNDWSKCRQKAFSKRGRGKEQLSKELIRKAEAERIAIEERNVRRSSKVSRTEKSGRRGCTSGG